MPGMLGNAVTSAQTCQGALHFFTECFGFLELAYIYTDSQSLVTQGRG